MNVRSENVPVVASQATMHMTPSTPRSWKGSNSRKLKEGRMAELYRCERISSRGFLEVLLNRKRIWGGAVGLSGLGAGAKPMRRDAKSQRAAGVRTATNGRGFMKGYGSGMMSMKGYGRGARSRRTLWRSM